MIEEVDPRFRHLDVKIGLFLALALAACLGAVFYIGAGNDLFTSKYVLHFTVDKGTGFAEGMPLKLSGFRIGRIRDITLNQQARVNIQVEIARKYQQWIRSDSVARLAKEGLVGDEIIELSVGSPDRPMLEDGATLRFEKTKSLEEHAEEIAEKVKPVLGEVRDIIGYINDPQGDFKKSLNNLQVLSSELKTVRGEAGRELTATVDNLNRVISQAGGLLDHSEHSLHAFETTLGGVDQAVGTVQQQLPDLLARLDRILDNLEATSANLRQVAGQAAPQIPALVEQVDDTVKQTRQVLGAVQDIWLIRRHLPAEKPLIVEGDSHE